MASTYLLTDELQLPQPALQPSHPMDSSAVLLELMRLARRAVAPAASGDSLEGVISKSVLRSLLSALHVRNVGTVKHCRRVAMLAVGLAQYLGWEGRHLKLLEVAGLLHDIGKIGVPDNILLKPGSLSPEEAELMSLHHDIGMDVLQACRVDPEVLRIVGLSLTYYNGVTDETKRIGSDVHQGARILAACDAYDSMRSDQVYRQARPHEAVMQELQAASGTQFDGNVVSALGRWFASEKGAASRRALERNADDPPLGPVHAQDAAEAGILGQIFAHLYLLESLYDGFFLLDSDLRFTVWNLGAERLLGRSAEAMLHHMWTSRLLAYSDREGKLLADHECLMHRVIATGKTATATVKLQHADGRWIDVELQSVPVVDAHGELHGVAEIFRDLSRTCRRSNEYRKLKLAASRDSLTSVANRGELELQLIGLLTELSQRPQPAPLSVLFLDVDYFKSINDTYGHSVGDQVLIEIARLLQNETYSGEIVGRYGGEEFVVLCPDTDLEQAVRRADRLRVAINNREISSLHDRRVSVSFGVAQAEPGDTMESLLRRADQALYMAKETGRNRTCSLTTEQLASGVVVQTAEKTSEAQSFRFASSFRACVGADMIVYKLGGFVDDQNARLVEVAPHRAVVRLGKCGLWPFWGTCPTDRPVEMEVGFGELKGSWRPGDRRSLSQVTVDVRIRPLGWVRREEVFQQRAREVFKALRAYFAGE